MTGKKSSREKRRKRSGQEAAAALAAPDLVPVLSGSAGGCGSGGCCGVAGSGTSVAGGAERSERRKRRSTDSSSSVSGSLQQETKYLLPSLEKELFLAEHSDLEEGGLDLTVSLKPVSFYISDKKEMLQQCFCIIGEKKLQKMLPDVLKARCLYRFYFIPEREQTIRRFGIKTRVTDNVNKLWLECIG
ncbi:caspase activity and apoptosis inhibitor 1 isoform X5 [Arvicanthis niloticus]|uniref:caspase activity and apoptosis inhibitor 1 isoform X5 n=1 Tax=Arvicanthis niloticus TaxID=61156 RepID=UPI00402B9E1F